jgi:hypothetical protein
MNRRILFMTTWPYGLVKIEIVNGMLTISKFEKPSFTANYQQIVQKVHWLHTCQV